MSTYMVYHINKIMDKNLLILSIEAKIVFDKINQFMKEKKKLSNNGYIEGIFLNIINVLCEKPTANIIFNG